MKRYGTWRNCHATNASRPRPHFAFDRPLVYSRKADANLTVDSSYQRCSAGAHCHVHSYSSALRIPDSCLGQMKPANTAVITGVTESHEISR